jgi:SAM-dependent methyltransferase
LEALGDGWIQPPGSIVDLGCGLGVEASYLAGIGFAATGVDLDAAALRQVSRGSKAHFLRANVTALPFASASIGFLLDRGCFHYLAPDDRAAYASEARRVLAPGGRLLLRACLTAAGTRNDIDEALLRRTFAGWRFVRVDRGRIPSDTRTMEAIIARLET